MKMNKRLKVIAKKKNYKFTNDILEKLYSVLDVIVKNSDTPENFAVVNGKITYFYQIIFSKLATLQNIDFCLKNNSITDAYTLLRKYRDDLFLYIYLLLINQKQKDMQFDISEQEKFENEIEAFETWMKGLIGEEEYITIKKKNFDFKIYIRKIREISEEIECLFKKFFPKKFKKISRVLNNYVHSNGLYYVINGFSDDNIKRIEHFTETIIDITIIFMGCLLLINSYCFRSDDYLSALEMDIPPLPDSQYWIDPVLSKFLKKYFSKELLQYLHENNFHKMILIEDKNN